MTGKVAAIYARVSSEQQAEAGTIGSQLAALRERCAADGIPLTDEMQFVDDGYSGATLVRPSLERLRDLVAAGGLDRLYVHSPDRLARKYAYQVLLLDEFQRTGVEVVFLNRQMGQTPEDDLLLQVQGMVAEYERAKILERSRRGKRHAAHSGLVSVLSNAPYGYRYVAKQDGGGTARWEVVLEEAQVVRQMFDWVGRERTTISEVCRRLRQAGTRTPSGKTWWDRSTVWGLLANPAYKGTAAFGKTRIGPMRARVRAPRGASEQPRNAYSTYDQPVENWILIPVPPIIGEDVFQEVQEQLHDNQKRARQQRRGARYLLQGLVTCRKCRYAYYGKPVSLPAAKGTKREYAYYRCIGTDAYRFGGQRVCANTQVRTDLLDEAVWNEVRSLLEHPARIEEEHRRRATAPSRRSPWETPEELKLQVGKVRRGISRLIDSYTEGLINKDDFEPRMKALKERLANLDAQAKQISDEASRETDLRLIIGRLEEFATKVKEGLTRVDWAARREIIRTLVKRVEVDEKNVNVVFRVDPRPFAGSPDRGILQDCGRRHVPAQGEALGNGRKAASEPRRGGIHGACACMSPLRGCDSPVLPCPQGFALGCWTSPLRGSC